MAKRFSRKVTRKTKVRLSPKEALEVIKREFSDGKGNKSTVIYDVKPQKWNEPTIEVQNSAKYTPKGED